MTPSNPITYLAHGCGVSVLFQEPDSILWFIEMVTEQGGVVSFERLPEGKIA